MLAKPFRMRYDPLMELRHLRYFVAVAAHGSFKRAAEVLNLTQPPLSRQVRDLEEQLGVPLFVRGTNSVKLTEMGESFYEDAREVLARADEAVRRVRNQSGKEVLKVGYPPSMTHGLMSAALAKFQAATSGVSVELADLSSREIVEIATEGRLDVIVCPGVSVPKGIRGFHLTELCRLQMVLVLSKEHPLAKLEEIPVDRLDQLPLIGLAKDNHPAYVPAIRALFKPHGVSVRFVSLVSAGVCALLDELAARDAAAVFTEGITGMLPPSLVTRPFVPKLPGFPVTIGLPAVSPKPHAELFARFLMEEAQSR